MRGIYSLGYIRQALSLECANEASTKERLLSKYDYMRCIGGNKDVPESTSPTKSYKLKVAESGAIDHTQ